MKCKGEFDAIEEGSVKKKISNPFNHNINPYSVNICGVKGATLLYDSIKNDIHKNAGYYEKVEYLVEVMEDDINKGRGNKSPLYKATLEGTLHTDFVKIAKFLIEKGARNDYVEDMTPLHLAAVTCSVPVLEAFAENNYDFTLKAGPARDRTVINLILSSKPSGIVLQKTLATIPVEQLSIIWKETIINPLHLSTEERGVIDCFIASNKLAPLTGEFNLKEKDTSCDSQDGSSNSFHDENLEEGVVADMFFSETKGTLESLRVNGQIGTFESVLITGEAEEQKD